MSTYIEPEYAEALVTLGTVIDTCLNPGIKNRSDKKHGFALLLFEFNTEGRTNFITNANQADMLTAMKEFIARAEGRMKDSDKVQ